MGHHHVECLWLYILNNYPTGSTLSKDIKLWYIFPGGHIVKKSPTFLHIAVRDFRVIADLHKHENNTILCQNRDKSPKEIAGNPRFANTWKSYSHDDVIKWKHFPRYLPFVRGIHRSPMNSPHKGQCCGALMFSLICAWVNGWVNNGEAGDLRRYRSHYDVIVMPTRCVG